MMFAEHFKLCYEWLSKRAPCAYYTDTCICLNEKMVHDDRHRLFTPVLRKATKDDGPFLMSPELSDFSMKISDTFLSHAERIIEVCSHVPVYL